jgi:hypothetical protein
LQSKKAEVASTSAFFMCCTSPDCSGILFGQCCIIKNEARKWLDTPGDQKDKAKSWISS